MAASWSWYASRAAGLVAYALLWLTVLWGTLLTSKPLGRKLKQATTLDLHRVLSAATWVFAAVHAGVLLFDRYIGFHLAQLLVPFTAKKDAFWVGLGVVAFELGLAVAVSYRFKARMGQRAWRLLHLASYPVWVMALAHGVAIGTDARQGVVLVGFGVSALAVVFALAFRVFYRVEKLTASSARG